MMAKREYKTIRKDTQRMIDGWEGTDVDFKQSVGGAQAEDMVAFANASGGTILIGVAEIEDEGAQRGTVVGCEVNDRNRNALVSRAQQCAPPVDITIVAENTGTEGKHILRVDIPEGHCKPYGTQGGTYKVRVDGQRAAMHPPQLLAEFLDREKETFLSQFAAAAKEVIAEMQHMEERLLTNLGEVEAAANAACEAAEKANDAAQQAQSVAQDAAWAAEDAAIAAEDIGFER